MNNRIDGLVPPHDIDAEAAVLAAVLLDGTLALQQIPELEPKHFYSGAHEGIFEACKQLEKSGEPIDVQQVGSWLKDRRDDGSTRLAQIGGMEYLGTILNAVPVIKNVGAYAKKVIEKKQLRNLIVATTQITARAHGDTGDISAFIAAASASISAAATAPTKLEPHYVLENASEIAAPLPSITWLSPSLRIARESLTIVGGFGYSRKTLYAQSLALAIASGLPALGVFNVTQAPVVHIDYEQGQRMTRERYQRMARVAGIDLRSALLTTITFPRFRLTSPGARDVLRRMLEETRAGFVVIDSLRASISGIDENSSEIREPIDVVSQECKRVKAAVLIIHHARKPSAGEKGGVRYSLRGSGAIFDSVDNLFMLSGEKGEHTTVEHEKDRLLGNALDAFGLNSEDVERDGDRRWGLRLVHMEPEQLRQIEAAKIRLAEEAKQTKKENATGPASAKGNKRPVPEDIC